MSKIRLILAVSMFALAMGQAQAQVQEPEWRVTNTNPARVIPLYAGQSNPFPIRMPEVVVPEPQVESTLTSEEELAARQLAKARQTAEEAVRAPNALLPEISVIQPNGYLKGAKGPMVLIAGYWYGQEDSIRVRNYVNPDTMSKINALEEFDPLLKETLLRQVQQRLQKEPRGLVKIAVIRPGAIIVKGPSLEREIAISQQDW